MGMFDTARKVPLYCAKGRHDFLGDIQYKPSIALESGKFYRPNMRETDLGEPVEKMPPGSHTFSGTGWCPEHDPRGTDWLRYIRCEVFIEDGRIVRVVQLPEKA